MRQRTLNWSGAMRDMRRERSPERLLMGEMVLVLKQSRSVLNTAYHDIEDETAKQVIARRIEKISGVLAKAEKQFPSIIRDVRVSHG